MRISAKVDYVVRAALRSLKDLPPYSGDDPSISGRAIRRGAPVQYRTEGNQVPAGSVYSPLTITFIGFIARRPCPRHHRQRSD